MMPLSSSRPTRSFTEFTIDPLISSNVSRLTVPLEHWLFPLHCPWQDPTCRHQTKQRHHNEGTEDCFLHNFWSYWTELVLNCPVSTPWCDLLIKIHSHWPSQVTWPPAQNTIGWYSGLLRYFPCFLILIWFLCELGALAKKAICDVTLMWAKYLSKRPFFIFSPLLILDGDSAPNDENFFTLSKWNNG